VGLLDLVSSVMLAQYIPKAYDLVLQLF
jgi:hypothetical protein